MTLGRMHHKYTLYPLAMIALPICVMHTSGNWLGKCLCTLRPEMMVHMW